MTKISNYGTFKDSLNAPIHRWFTYPAGYSHKLVEAKCAQFSIGKGSLIADPFVGTGTTSLSAKSLGIDSIGVEAHPFVHWVAQTKLDSNHDTDLLKKEAAIIVEQAHDLLSEKYFDTAEWPDLIYKCFDTDNLKQLYALKTEVLALTSERQDFFKLALTATLRDTTSAGAGWPYIAPSKFAKRKIKRNAFEEFSKRCALMADDVETFTALRSKHKLVKGDARNLISHTGEGNVDLILTSPPYLNNYDYADRTRMETYFWGLYNSWADITTNVRDKLMMATTTQVRRGKMVDTAEMPIVKLLDAKIHAELQNAVSRLGELRKRKSGNKSYDMMTAGYFEDISQVILQAHTALKPGCPFILVLGDSAPYGVHVPTDEIIGRLALGAGFSDYSIEVIRTRGDKWANNSQRHKVPLRESIVTVIR
ncbi:MAG: site-specific DNA-methyltransferase [Acidimicrobiia bacterium]|nr:site-specific DNA-methyltransferase [Acidimicrobiia bacterium]MYC58409.1 site-specific DNA-methyltransferase [Acidimicrobiia bacterium]MYI30485.1 site-specific DNA-methyltransferase [Acidimicrobiia bacterium]